MKSYNHIWEQMLTKENITKAVRKASLGKRERPAVKRILSNLDREIPKESGHLFMPEDVVGTRMAETD